MTDIPFTARGRRNGYAWLLGTLIGTGLGEIQWRRQLRREAEHRRAANIGNARRQAARDALIEVERRYKAWGNNGEDARTFAEVISEMRSEVEWTIR